MCQLLVANHMPDHRKYRGHRVSLVVPEDIYQKLKNKAEAQNRPVANLCVTIITEYINSEETTSNQ